jgi:tetratricopeptide (TPR) repeat protein
MTKRFYVVQTVVVFAIAIFMSSCGTNSKLTQNIKTADNAFNSGDMKSALENYEHTISYYEGKNMSKECPVYTKAGIAAAKLGETEKAINYLDKARYSASESPETYWELAKCYRKIDNLSKEMTTLETYKEKYPADSNIKKVNERLFEIYTQSENYDKALAVWPSIKNGAANNKDLITDYFTVNKAIGNSDVCDSLATEMLKNDKNNVLALEWKAEKYYNRAEKLYQKEMKAYNKHKTRRQYAHLLKALDRVTADFKISLKYFKQLYSINADPKYARYLANIYNRLDDKSKAAYYKKRAGI